MKKFVISSLLTTGLFVWQTSPTLASGVNYYRNLQSNSILKCASPRQIEIIWVGGDVSHYGSAHTIICLKNDRQAEWIIQSSIECQSRKVPLQNCPSLFTDQQLQSSTITQVFNPNKTAIGMNCKITTRPAKYSEDLDYYWTCEKYQARKNLTIKTTGQKFSVNNRDGDEKNKFWLHTYDNPSCKKDSQLGSCFQPYPGFDDPKYRPEMSIDCRGDAQFCKYYYQPYQF